MALSSTAGMGMPIGYEQEASEQQLQRRPQGGGYSSTSAVQQLFARLAQEIEEKQPKNCIHFMVDFLCKHYPEHLHGFASIWQMDPDLERERHEVVNFFKAHKISTAVAAHFTNAGYDTLDTLTTLTPDSLVDVEAFNNVKWLPGHKVRLQQIFSEIQARVRSYRQQYDSAKGVHSPRHHSSPHHPHHHHHAAHHHAAPHLPHSSAHQATVHHPAVTSVVHRQASPYVVSSHAPGSYPTTAQPSLYSHAPAVAAPTAISAGIGQGVAAPALPPAGNLFAQHSLYPAA